MYTLRLLATIFKVNLQQEMAYRANAVINMLMSVLWLGWEFQSLLIIFSNTDTLGGWGPGELVALLGVWRLVNTLMAAMIWPSTERFNTAIRDGSLDYTLLQPAHSLFLVSFKRIVIWRVWDIGLGIALIVFGLNISNIATSAASVASFLLLVGSGVLVIYSLWVVLIACTFWFVKFDNNVTILQALMDAGRYPATVYPAWLRVIVTFVIPIAVATTVPLQALRGDLAFWQIALFFGVGVVAFVVALQIWNAGVKRYSGASS